MASANVRMSRTTNFVDISFLLHQHYNLSYKVSLLSTALDTLSLSSETAMGVHVNTQKGENMRYVKAIYHVGEEFIHRCIRPWLWPTLLFRLSTRGRTYYENLSILHQFSQKVRRLYHNFDKRVLTATALKRYWSVPSLLKVILTASEEKNIFHESCRSLTNERLRS